LVALWFVGHDAAAWVLRPAVLLVMRYVYVDRWRRLLTSFGPYTTLFLLAVPLLVVEPAKLVALYVIGLRHYFMGTGILILAYAVSLLIVDRIFELNKKKLLTIRWLAELYAVWERFHRRLYADIRNTPTWRRARWLWLNLRRQRRRLRR
jgi:hypothetical protein